MKSLNRVFFLLVIFLLRYAYIISKGYNHFVISVTGNYGVGKTCLLHQFMGQVSPTSSESGSFIQSQAAAEMTLNSHASVASKSSAVVITENTTSVGLHENTDFLVRRIEIDDERVRLQVWDTAGQEKFNSLSYKFYRGANGVLLVYDITRRHTFEDISLWLDNTRKHCNQDIQATLIGNKCDMNDRRQVTYAQGENLAKKLNMPFFETSSKDDSLINYAFMELVRLILKDCPFPMIVPKYLQEQDAEKIFCSCCSWQHVWCRM